MTGQTAATGFTEVARIERAVSVFGGEGFDSGASLLQGSESYSFAEQRTVFRQIETTTILETLDSSTDTIAQRANAQLSQVAEGEGPTLAEFSAWLDDNDASAEQSQTYVAMYLRMAEAFEERSFAGALATAPTLTAEIELADASEDGGIGSLLDAPVAEPLALTAETDDLRVLAASLEETADVTDVFVADRRVDVDAEGRFRVAFSSKTVINEDISITIVHADGSVTERPMFAEPDPETPGFAETSRVARGPDGSVGGEVRLRDPASVRQVLLGGVAVDMAADGRVVLEALPAEASEAGYVPLIVMRDDGNAELNRLAVTDEPPLLDASVAPNNRGNLQGRAKAGDAEDIASVLVDGEPVDVAEDGSFNFLLSESSLTVNRSVDITIVYANGARAVQQLALDKEVPVAELDSFRTGGGLKMVEGRIADPDEIDELRIGNQEVPLAADGSFVAPVPETAETDAGFVPMTVLFDDGTMAAEEIAPTPAPLLADIDARTTPEGEEVVDGRIEDVEEVAELLLGDTPVLFTSDGRFSLTRSSVEIADSFSLSVVYRDGSTRTQSLRNRDRSAAVVTDLTPVRTRNGREISGRLANSDEVAQVWVGDERLSIDEEGRFALTLQETSFDAVETLDLTLVFKDGSRLDENLALRDTPPLETAGFTTDAEGRPAIAGQLANVDDVAEVRVDGRPVPVSEDGSFSLAVTSEDVSISSSLSITIIHKDGSRTERRVASVSRTAVSALNPVLTETGELAVEDGKVRAAGLLAEPEAVAALEVADEAVELDEDGGFLLEIDETVVNVNESIDITIIYKDGGKAEQELALTPPLLEAELATVETPEGEPEVRGRLPETEDVAGLLVDGRFVPVDEEGRFRFSASARESTTTISEQVSITDINEQVSVTVLYADGRRAEQQVALDAQPLLSEIDVTETEDGTLKLAAEITGIEDVAEVLVDGQPLEINEDGGIEILVNRTEINIDRSISITIIFADGLRRSQLVAVDSLTTLETVTTRRREDGRPVLAGVLENSETVAALRIDGRSVAVAEDGSFEIALTRAETTIDRAVDMTIVYANGARADRRVALRESPPVMETDLFRAPDGSPVAEWEMADPERVAEVRIDGRPVEMTQDGRVSLALTETEINVTENVSLTIIYKDGSRLEQRARLEQRREINEIAVVATSAEGAVVEGRLDDIGRVRQVLIEGRTLDIGADGSFRIDMAELSVSERRSLSMTIILAGGSRKVERLGVTAANMFASFEAVSTAAGQQLAEGRVAEPELVAGVLIDGREVDLAEDGSFSLEVSRTRIDISHDVSVTIIYEDGARVSRRVALRDDTFIRDLDIVAGTADEGQVSGRLADLGRIASLTFGGEIVAVAADGTFRFTTSREVSETRVLEVVYRDGTRQSKSISLSARQAFAGIDTYAAADGSGVVEGRLANAADIAALFIDGERVRISGDGGFVYRQRSLNVSRTSQVSLRIVYRNGAVSGRRISMNTSLSRSVMLINTVNRTADGFTVTEALLGRGASVAGLEIAGRTFRASSQGRITFALLSAGAAETQRVRVRVLYDNGLDAETWLTPARVAGGLVALPRTPRKIALVIGNNRYGSGIGTVATARADAGRDLQVYSAAAQVFPDILDVAVDRPALLFDILKRAGIEADVLFDEDERAARERQMAEAAMEMAEAAEQQPASPLQGVFP